MAPSGDSLTLAVILAIRALLVNNISVLIAVMGARQTFARRSADAILACFPELRDRIYVPARPRRFWSHNKLISAPEQSVGVYEMVLLEKCDQMTAHGWPDWADHYYKSLTRLTRDDFNELHDKYGVLLEHHSPRGAVCSRKRLAITLTWLAHGHTFQHLGLIYGLAHNTVGAICKETLHMLLEYMLPREVQMPTGEELLSVAAGFERLCGMPCCIGAVDGTFFHVNQPRHWGGGIFLL
jgi:hypothetical protein